MGGRWAVAGQWEEGRVQKMSRKKRNIEQPELEVIVFPSLC